MKKINRKSLILTCLTCLLPIVFGLALWDKLPDTMAIHFNIKNEPDNFASKEFVVFALPCLMALVQCFCAVVADIDSRKRGNKEITKWIIPAVTVVLQVVTLAYGMGKNIDMRIVAVTILAVLFIVIGIFGRKK